MSTGSERTLSGTAHSHRCPAPRPASAQPNFSTSAAHCSARSRTIFDYLRSIVRSILSRAFVISFDSLSKYSRGLAARKILQGGGEVHAQSTACTVTYLLINPACHGQNWSRHL